MPFVKKLFLLLGFCFNLTAFAANIDTLGQNNTWLRLLHYQKSLTGEARSAIHSPEFFLSSKGRSDPVAELRETVKAMQEPIVIGQENEHAKCRFPARRIWLEKTLSGMAESFSAITCPAFEEWGSPKQIGSVSLVFANGYLGNPASYYGHIFLKFNRDKQGASHLIDQTANFGAVEIKGDNAVVYIFKALVGGYDGGFSQADFFFHDATYTENELRDLWEYRLNLSADEVEFVVSHTWEVQQKRYTYFFFHDNCAFRVGELLEIVDGVKAIPENRPWIIPQAVLQKVAGEIRNGRPLVSEKIVHTSRQSRLYQRYAALDERSKTEVHSLVKKKSSFKLEDFASLHTSQQQAVVDTVLDYYQFLGGEITANGEKKMPEEYILALQARLRLPPAEEQLNSKKKLAPDTALPPGWVQLGTGHQEGVGVVRTLRVRPAYYDPLDGSTAQAPFSGLSMGDLMLEALDEKVQIKRLDIVAVDSVSPSVTGLPGDGGKGWRVRFGLEKDRLTCTDGCLLSRLQGDYLWAVLPGNSNIFASINLGGAIQSHGQRDGAGFLRSGFGLTARLPNGVGARFAKEYRYPFETGRSPYSTSVLETRLPFAEKYDARLTWERDFDSRVMIGAGLYW